MKRFPYERYASEHRNQILPLAISVLIATAIVTWSVEFDSQSGASKSSARTGAVSQASKTSEANIAKQSNAPVNKVADQASNQKVDIGQPLVVDNPLEVHDIQPSDGKNGSAFALLSGAPIFPLPFWEDMTAYEGQPVEMQYVKVQQTTSGGYWVGENERQRVFVAVGGARIDDPDLQPDRIRVGERLNISGRMSPLAKFRSTTGVGPDQGLSKLLLQKEVVDANSIRVPTQPVPNES